MLSWIPSGFRRPRAIFLSAMIVVVAVLLGRNSRTQRESVSDQVSAWTERAVMAAQDSRDDDVRELGGSEACPRKIPAYFIDSLPDRDEPDEVLCECAKIWFDVNFLI
jgi:hypothetical protein